MSTIIYADPVLALAAELRAEAAQNRRVWKDESRAAHLEHIAARIEEAVERGADNTWMPLPAAAKLLHKHPETIRLRCRGDLASRGLARKRGGHWEVHVDALAA